MPAGGHTIRVTYLPESFVRGRAISFSTMALLLGGGLAARLRRRRGDTRGETMSLSGYVRDKRGAGGLAGVFVAD